MLLGINKLTPHWDHASMKQTDHYNDELNTMKMVDCPHKRTNGDVLSKYLNYYKRKNRKDMN